MFKFNKTIISCAVTGGVHTPSMSPYLPITPKQIEDSAVEAHASEFVELIVKENES